MAEAAIYLSALGLFSFVTFASAFMRHEMLLLACIPPVFVALISGFTMALYAADRFGPGLVVAALLVPGPPAWWLARRLRAKDLLIAIYLSWAVGMVVALAGFSFPDG